MAKLFHDVLLDQMAMKKCDEGCRPNLKDAADETMRTGISAEIIQAMQLAEARGFLHPDLTLTLVQINQALLFFKTDADSVKALVSVMVPKTKNSVPIPPKVIVKMAALRLNKLVKSLHEHNRNASDRNASNAAQAAAGQAWAMGQPPVPSLTVPDELRTVEATKRALQDLVNLRSWQARDIEKDFVMLFAKPELTDEHISAGWDLVLTGEVMDG